MYAETRSRRIASAYHAEYVPYPDWGCGSMAPEIRAYDAVERSFFDFRSLMDHATAFAEGSLEGLRRRLPPAASVRDGLDLYIRDHGLNGSKARRARFSVEQMLIENCYAGPAETTSLRGFWEADEFAGGSHVFPKGYGALTAGLAKPLDIRLNHPVTTIRYDARRAVVTTPHGALAAPKVLVTVSLGVLKAGTIAFDPPLPAQKQRAIRRLGMGTLEKVILVFADKFWPGRGLAYVGEPAGEVPIYYDFTAVYGVPTLVGWHGGTPATAALRDKTDEAIVASALTKLEDAYGMSVPKPTAYQVTRWQQDPYTRGSYAYIAAGASADDMEALGEPVGPTLLFAGEATESRYYGQTHGAVISGLREARRIARHASLDRL